ncbi:hypothetical protein AB0N89_07650 [Amycolatopsis sp. NPDC089917]|uniref:hypothetical protein n=1 Tax=Amycolatopsis sp. NPDC089917 TaxID=3155187 RepID=UPI003413FD23
MAVSRANSALAEETTPGSPSTRRPIEAGAGTAEQSIPAFGNGDFTRSPDEFTGVERTRLGMKSTYGGNFTVS